MSTAENQLEYDKEEVRGALGLLDLCRRWNVVMEGCGVDDYVGRCPLHEEKTGSFHVHPEGGYWKCFGCGAGGKDVFALWAARAGLDCQSKTDWPVILRGVAELAGVPGRMKVKGKGKRTERKGLGTESGSRQEVIEEKRSMLGRSLVESGAVRCGRVEGLRAMTGREVVQLSELRGGIDHEAVYAMMDLGQLYYSEWPLDDQGRANSWTVPSWYVTDKEGWCGQWRSLSGKPYYDKPEWKSYSTKNVGWVVGCADWTPEMEEVVLCEGGGDMLAAYHFLGRLELLGRVGVGCLFGGSARIVPECLPYFQGRRVRILMDWDEPKEKKFTRRPSVWVRPGCEAAYAWQEALRGTAASVEVVSWEPLAAAWNNGREWMLERAGLGLEKGVKDLGDLVRWDLAWPGTVDVRGVFVPGLPGQATAIDDRG